MIKKQIIIDEETYCELPLTIINEIISTAKKGWGVKFISRETGKEVENISVVGLFLPAISKILKNT